MEHQATGDHFLAVFPKQDRALVEKRLDSLETEIRNLLKRGEASNFFVDEAEGLRFCGNAKKVKHGRIINIQQAPQDSYDHLDRIDAFLQAPPTKHTAIDLSRPNPPVTLTDATNIAAQNNYTGSFSYASAALASTRTSKIIQKSSNNSTSAKVTTEHTSSTITYFEKRIVVIESKQEQMDSRLSNLEHTCNDSSDNILTMMEEMGIKRRSKDNKRARNDDSTVTNGEILEDDVTMFP
jgi:chaperonin cofactor prefoldin